MKKLLIIAASALVLVSCGKERFANTNTDPNKVSEPDPSFLFLKAQMDMKSNEYLTWFYDADRTILPVTQITVGSQGGSNQNTMFQFGRTSGPDGILYNNIGGVVKRLQFVVKNYDEPKRLSYEYLCHMGQILMVHQAIRTTDLRGDIAYSKALQGLYTNPPLITPEFDTQESVFEQLDAELKNAVKVMSADVVDSKGAKVTQVAIKATQDPSYGGSYAKWVVFANSLRIRIAGRLLLIAPEKAKAIVREVVADGRYMKTIEEDYIYYNDKSTQDQNFGDARWSGVAGKEFTNFLRTNKDPRVRFFFQKNALNPITIQGLFDQGVKLPAYILDQIVYTPGTPNKFIRWKSAEDGDGAEFLGEPWVRYQGVPTMQQEDLIETIGQDAYNSYFQTASFEYAVPESSNKYSFMPYSEINTHFIQPNKNFTYPSTKEIRDEYRPQNSYYYQCTMTGAAEMSLTLALFSLNGVDINGIPASKLFQDGIRMSVESQNKMAAAHNIPYYTKAFMDVMYDATNNTYIAPDGTKKPVEKPVALQPGEIDDLLTSDAYTLKGDGDDLEKVYIQLIVNALPTVADIYPFMKFSGVPKYNSNLWPRDMFVKGGEATNKALDIPRRFFVGKPNGGGVNDANVLAAYARQGFVNFSVQPPQNEKYWYDKNSPAYGEGPKLAQ